MTNDLNIDTDKTPFLKKWWAILIVLASLLFIPYISDSAECITCTVDQLKCPPCLTYYQNLFQYLTN